jgi:hypothetical protein
MSAEQIEAGATCVLALTAIVGFALTLKQLKSDAAARTEESDARRLQAKSLQDEAEARKLQSEAIHGEIEWRKNEIWLRLLSMYEQSRMSEARSKTAAAMFDSQGEFDRWTFNTPNAAWAVLDFFESIAWGVQQDRLDIGDVWHSFYEPISIYVDTYKTAIAKERESRKDTTIYESLLSLRGLLDAEQRKRGGPVTPPSNDERKGFFVTELDPESPIAIKETLTDDDIPF